MYKWFKKNSQFIFGILFLWYFFLTLLQAIDLGDEVVFALLLTLIIYIQSVGTFLYYYIKKGKPRLQDWMRIAFFIMLVLNFMKIVNGSDGGTTINFSITTISLLDSAFTMLIIILAFFSLDVAYLISKTTKKTRAYNIQYYMMRKRWVFIILIVSTLIQIYLIFSGVSGYGSDLKYTTGTASLGKMLAGILNPFALITSAHIIFVENNHNLKYKCIFYISLSIQILLGLLSGMKESAIIPILYVGIVFLVAERKIHKKLIYSGLFLLLMLYPINNTYRNVINDSSLNTGSSILNMTIAVNKLLNEPILETLGTGAESYGDRGSMFSYFQYSINIEPSWDYYQNMTRYAFVPVSWFIPRAIWKEKPRADVGGVLSERIIGAENSSAVTPTSMGWSYLEGGVLFVIPIFILLGILFEIIDKSNLKKPIILIFYIILLHKALKPEWDPYFLFTSMMQMYVMYWLLLKLIGVKKVVYI